MLQLLSVILISDDNSFLLEVAIVENVQFAVQEIAEEAKRRQDGGNKGVMVDFDLANYHPYAEIMQYLMNLEGKKE